MRALRLIPVAAVAAALLAPASANAAPGWHDAGARVPDTVNLEAIARHGDTVVAVGTDTATGEPAVYRFDGTAWWRDKLPVEAGLGIKGQLLDVAANAAGAWAVGARQGGQPLLVYLPPAPPPADPAEEDEPTDPPDPTDPEPVDNSRTWTVLPAGGMAGLRSVSLFGDRGFAGDTAGELWPISATGTGDPVSAPRDVSVNGVALTDADTGFAVTDGGLAEARIFSIAPGSRAANSEVAVPDAAGRPVRAVASFGGAVLAADDRAYWRPDENHVWQRTAGGLGDSGFELADVALADGVVAFGGQVGADGYVWRGMIDDLLRQKVAASPVNGVAAYGAEDVWAVGDKGVVKHFHTPPPPPPPPDPDPTCTADCEKPDPPCTTCSNPDPGSSPGTDPPPATTTSESTTTTTVPPARQGDPTVYVVEPDKPATRRPAQPRPPRRLLDRVKVVRKAKRLVISFRLRAPARVAISAKRGRAVVSRSRTRALRPGRRRIVLPFTGAAPTELRIVVRPLRAKKAGSGARGGNAGV
jgi:hypothetical protein